MAHSNKGGVYQIRNEVTNQLYVGSAQNLRIRWQLHRSDLNRKKHHSILLQKAWDEYGEEHFIFEVLEYCDQPNLFERENHYLQALEPEYNIARIAESSNRGVKASDETKLKLSRAARRTKTDDSTPLHVVDKVRLTNTSLTDDDVRVVWDLAESGEYTNKQIAAIFEVNPTVIWKILNKRSYTWVTRA